MAWSGQNMEAVPCDLCGANIPIQYLNTRDRFSGKYFNLSMCKNCHLIYLNPRPNTGEMNEYYPEDYEAYFLPGDIGSKTSELSSKSTLAKQLNYVEQYHPEQGRLVDIGCATGNFLNLARAHGWQVIGIETNEGAVKTAQEIYKLNVLQSDLEHSNLPTNSVDVVTLWDVLEHLPSPKSAMRTIHNILRSRGMCYFSIPNLDSYDRKLFGPEWIGWDAPRHLVLFDMLNIQRLFDETGFRMINQRCISGGKGTFYLSLERVTQIKPYLKWLLHFHPLINLMLWPYRQYSYIRQRGPIITFAVQKI